MTRKSTDNLSEKSQSWCLLLSKPLAMPDPCIEIFFSMKSPPRFDSRRGWVRQLLLVTTGDRNRLVEHHVRRCAERDERRLGDRVRLAGRVARRRNDEDLAGQSRS